LPKKNDFSKEIVDFEKRLHHKKAGVEKEKALVKGIIGGYTPNEIKEIRELMKKLKKADHYLFL